MSVNLDEVEQAVSKRIVGGTAKVLTIDLERIPGTARVFDQKIRGGFIPVSQWLTMPRTVCWAAKWYDKRSIEFRAAWDDPQGMLQRSWELYDEADIVVTFNGRRFDNKVFRADWAMAGLPPPRPWKDVDLFVDAARLFAFESKSLRHLCDRLGVTNKTGHYSAEMAEAAMAGDLASQRKLRTYNAGDVRATEAAYDRLRPWLHNHPHMARTAEPVCNRCGSTDLERTTDYRAVLIDYAMYRCRNCSGLVRGGDHHRVATTRGVQ